MTWVEMGMMIDVTEGMFVTAVMVAVMPVISAELVMDEMDAMHVKSVMAGTNKGGWMTTMRMIMMMKMMMTTMMTMMRIVLMLVAAGGTMIMKADVEAHQVVPGLVLVLVVLLVVGSVNATAGMVAMAEMTGVTTGAKGAMTAGRNCHGDVVSKMGGGEERSHGGVVQAVVMAVMAVMAVTANATATASTEETVVASAIVVTAAIVVVVETATAAVVVMLVVVLVVVALAEEAVVTMGIALTVMIGIVETAVTVVTEIGQIAENPEAGRGVGMDTVEREASPSLGSHPSRITTCWLICQRCN